MARETADRMPFERVYPLLIAKAEKKGRTRAEVDAVTCWLTGYTPADLAAFLASDLTYGEFFARASHPNENRHLVRGVVCGVRIEDIADPQMQQIRRLDKLVDELARGRPLEKILRRPD